MKEQSREIERERERGRESKWMEERKSDKKQEMLEAQLVPYSTVQYFPA